MQGIKTAMAAFAIVLAALIPIALHSLPDVTGEASPHSAKHSEAAEPPKAEPSQAEAGEAPSEAARAEAITTVTTTTVPVKADAFVRESVPDGNFGGIDTIAACNDCPIYSGLPAITRSFVSFAPAGIDPASVTSATLQFRAVEDTAYGGSIRRVADDAWTESGITYANQPAADATQLAEANRAVALGETVSFDVTSAVKADGVNSVHSFRLASVFSDAAVYASKENATLAAPVMVIESTPPPTDTTPPETSITSGPAQGSTDSDGAVSFSFSSSEAGSSFRCSLDGAPFESCQSPRDYPNLGDGQHNFAVKAVDAAGNVDATPAARSFSVQRPQVGFENTDSDGDGVRDLRDNCAANSNPLQTDSDGDGLGNVCDETPNTKNVNNGNDQMRIKTNGCNVYATNQVDPIAFSLHQHRQFGNTSTTNQSTADSLLAHGRNSCDPKSDWFTSAAWFPVEREEGVIGISTYYRAPGDQTDVRPIPKGLQMLASEEKYNCSVGNFEGSFEEKPPYGCSGNWTTRVIFPNCWNMKGKEEENMEYATNDYRTCPSSHPYKIPQISFLIRHDNADGKIPNPLQVSKGTNEWGTYDFMHADYFAALKPEFNASMLDRCLRNANDNQDVAAPVCGEGA